MQACALEESRLQLPAPCCSRRFQGVSIRRDVTSPPWHMWGPLEPFAQCVPCSNRHYPPNGRHCMRLAHVMRLPDGGLPATSHPHPDGGSGSHRPDSAWAEMLPLDGSVLGRTPGVATTIARRTRPHKQHPRLEDKHHPTPTRQPGSRRWSPQSMPVRRLKAISH